MAHPARGGGQPSGYARAKRARARQLRTQSAQTTTATVPRWLSKYGMGAWYLIGMAIVIGIVVWATSQITMVFMAVFLALVGTAILFPVVRLLARFMPRAVATVIAILGSFALFGGLVFYVITSIQGEWDELTDRFSDGADQIIAFFENGPLPWHFSRQEITDALRNAVDEGTKYVQDNAASLASQVWANASTVALVFTVLALSLFVAICLLYSGEKMWLWFINLLPQQKRHNTHRAAMAGWLTFSGYARGTMIVALSDGLLAFFLLWILGIPLAAPLAVLVLIGAFIPLVGAPAAMVVAMVVALAADGPGKALAVGVGIALIGQFEGHVLQPLVMGKQVSLHPVVVAIGVAAGTFVAGLLGAVIAIPIIAVIWAVFRVLYHTDAPLDELPPLDVDALVEAIPAD
ncbi:MAG: AI-2E family transporter [Bowdeniella nasicola]|nr:AI-2E family transporter [Bowdeniella nasicola]